MKILVSIVLVVIAIVGFGCEASVGPETEIDPSNTLTQGTSNTLTMTEAKWDQVTRGVYGTGIQIDDDGIHQLSGGPYRVVGTVIDTEGNIKLFGTGPDDISLGSLNVTLPTGMEVTMTDLNASNSSVIAAFNEAVISSLEADVNITQAQVEEVKAKLEAGVNVLRALSEVGINAINLAITGG